MQTCDDAVYVRVTPRVGGEEVREAHDDKAEEDGKDSNPVEIAEAAAQEGHRKQACEHYHGTCGEERWKLFQFQKRDL